MANVASQDSQPIVLTIREAADRLKISEYFVGELARSGKLRSVKIGRRRLIPVDAIGDFIASMAA